MLRKQAKLLSDAQIKTVLSFLTTTRYPHRNRVVFLLSLHGLRAKEIANLTIAMITNSDGTVADSIAIQNKASKGESGRVVYMGSCLKKAIEQYLTSTERRDSDYLITTQRSIKFTANGVAVFFKRLYSSLGFENTSSHSGRRTYITNCARNISRVGGSIRDVMALAGHKHLATTQRYIEQDVDAQKKVAQLIYRLS